MHKKYSLKYFDQLSDNEQSNYLHEKSLKREFFTISEKIYFEYELYKYQSEHEQFLWEILGPSVQANPECVAIIIDLIEQEQVSYLKLDLARVLSVYGNPIVIPTLEQLMNTSSAQDAAVELIRFNHHEAQKFLIDFVKKPSRHEKCETKVRFAIEGLEEIDNHMARETILMITGGKTAAELAAEKKAAYAPPLPQGSMIVAMYELVRNDLRAKLLDRSFINKAVQLITTNPTDIDGLLYCFNKEKKLSFRAQLGRILAQVGNERPRVLFYKIMLHKKDDIWLLYLATIGLVYLEDKIGITKFKELVRTRDQDIIAAFLLDLSGVKTQTAIDLIAFIHETEQTIRG